MCQQGGGGQWHLGDVQLTTIMYVPLEAPVRMMTISFDSLILTCSVLWIGDKGLIEFMFRSSKLPTLAAVRSHVIAREYLLLRPRALNISPDIESLHFTNGFQVFNPCAEHCAGMLSNDGSLCCPTSDCTACTAPHHLSVWLRAGQSPHIFRVRRAAISTLPPWTLHLATTWR